MLTSFPISALSLSLFTMLSSSASSSAPLALLYLLLSLGLSGTDARATPNPAPVSSPGRTIPMMRRNVKRSVEDAESWLENNRLATHLKYGLSPQGDLQKRASGLNL